MRTIAKALQVSRSNLMRKNKSLKQKNSREEENLVERIKTILRERHPYGYRRVALHIRSSMINEASNLIEI